VLKLHGTNMAVRREVLLDRRFRPGVPLLSRRYRPVLRLADAGHRAQWLPDAQVHHAFAASDRRSADRVPLSLFDIGASTAVFLRKHAPDAMDDALLRLAEDQRARLFRLVRRRKLGAREVEALMRSLRDGIDAGTGQGAFGGPFHPAAGRCFLPLTDTPVERDVVLCGSALRARSCGRRPRG
jgi:hypothetical protein